MIKFMIPSKPKLANELPIKQYNLTNLLRNQVNSINDILQSNMIFKFLD